MLTAAGLRQEKDIITHLEGSSGVGLWRFARRHYERIFSKVEEKEEIIVSATATWVRAHATDTCIQFLDCRSPGTERGFLDALQEHQLREGR